MVDLSPSGVVIRKIERKEDICQASDIACQVPALATHAALLKAAARDPDASVWGMYSHEDTVLGYIAVAHGVFDAEINSLAVRPEVRGQGIGEHLVRHACEHARGLSRERMLLEVRVSNQAAISLYQRLGFVQDGLRRAYYPPLVAGAPREDAWLMSCAFV